jgi:hypothetical protein
LKLLALSLLMAVPLAADEKQVLWRDPGPLTMDHWTCGSGGCDRTPAPPFHFVKEDAGGTNPKVVLRDSKGLNWSVKFGGESIPECFASRYVTALGYLAEPAYFVASGKIEGVGHLKNASRVIHKDGTFVKGRFELRGQKDLVFLEGRYWSWVDNPFRGTHELAGLKLLVMLLSNWDIKDERDGDESNDNIFRVPGDNGGSFLFYGVSDWGASLGRWGNMRRRDKSDCAGFNRDTPLFIKGVHQNEVEFSYSGKHAEDVKHGISIDDIRWLLPKLQRVTTGELRTGLKASGATERQTTCWSNSIEDRIRQLQAVAR